MNTAPVALTIAGSDSSAGAGVQADLKTFSALGVYGVCAVTCVVAETPGKVTSIAPVAPREVRAQIEVLLRKFPVCAAKTGLLHSGAVVSEVATVLREFASARGAALALVVDPVMVATSGDRLLDRDAVARYETELFPLAALVTPNLDEAAALAGFPIRDTDAMRRAGAELAGRYGTAFLLKGGHLPGEKATDFLFSDNQTIQLTAPFTRGVRTHGTGCTYSAAIAAGLAQKLSLEPAARRAKSYVSRAIADYFSWRAEDGGELHALNHEARDSGTVR